MNQAGITPRDDHAAAQRLVSQSGIVSQAQLERDGQQALDRLSSEQQLDNRIWVTTPEQIRFRYQTVGAMKRLMAFATDGIIMAAVLGAVLLLLWLTVAFFSYAANLPPFFSELIGGLSVFFSLLIIFVSYWLSSALQEYFFNGLTVGKRIAGIRTVSLDGRPPSMMQCFGRNFLRLADGLPLFPTVFLLPSEAPLEYMPAFVVVPTFLAGLISMLMTERFQRIGDLFAGTMVVENESYTTAHVPVFNDRELLSLAMQIPMDFHAGRELLETLSLYVGRRIGFHHERRSYMAAHLARPLIQKWGLPANTNYDLLIGALYVRSVMEYAQVESMYTDLDAAASTFSGKLNPPGAAPAQVQFTSPVVSREISS